MSRQDLVKRHLGKELHCLESEFIGAETPRTIFYSNEVQEIIAGADPETRDGLRFDRAKAIMDAFIELGWVTIAQDPQDKDSKAIMARVSPVHYEIFDFRAIDPKPGIRILGCFIDPDEFVALTYDFREEFEGRWPEQVDRCRKEWERLFPNLEPHKGANVNDYITENAEAI